MELLVGGKKSTSSVWLNNGVPSFSMELYPGFIGSMSLVFFDNFFIWYLTAKRADSRRCYEFMSFPLGPEDRDTN